MTRRKCKFCNLLTDNAEKHEETCPSANVCELLILPENEKCGERFATKKGLSQHQAVKHTGEERGAPFICEMCTFGTFSQYDLNRHMRNHEEGRFAEGRRRSRSRGQSLARGARSRSRSNLRVAPPVATDRNDCSSTARRSNSRQPLSVAARRSNSRQPPSVTARRSNSRQPPSVAARRSNTRERNQNMLQNNLHQDEDNNELEMEENQVMPQGVDKDGLYNLRLINPKKAEAIIESCDQDLLNIVFSIQRSFESTNQICEARGINPFEAEEMRKKIKETIRCILDPEGL